MQQLKLLEDPPPPGAVPVWNALDDEQRTRVVIRLARMIAQIVDQKKENPELEDHHER